MTDSFQPNSRYYGLALRTRTRPDGTVETFVQRRIVPAVERHRIHDRIRTDAIERIDNVAASAFGDPELYWRLCDANGDAEPAEATRPLGRLIAIPLPLELADDGDA